MKIDIQTISHEEQRYPTCGDWWIDENGHWHILVSKMPDWKYEFLIAFHEFLELAWCVHNGISQNDINDFDIEYEQKRVEGDLSEPGDNPDAPYFRGHQMANLAERFAALCLGVNWKKYDDYVTSL